MPAYLIHFLLGAVSILYYAVGVQLCLWADDRNQFSVWVHLTLGGLVGVPAAIYVGIIEPLFRKEKS